MYSFLKAFLVLITLLIFHYRQYAFAAGWKWLHGPGLAYGP